jgi:hypothetical protein
MLCNFQDMLNLSKQRSAPCGPCRNCDCQS